MDPSSTTARLYEFQQFIQQILEHSRDIELVATPDHFRADNGFDFEAIRSGRPLVIQMKLSTPQTSYRLEQVNSQLKDAAERYRQLHHRADPKPVLAFPGVLSESKMAVAIRASLEIWDGPYLRARAQELGISTPPYIAFSESTEAVGWPGADRNYTHPLLRRLQGIRPGRAEWPAYEKYCEDLLNFLFVPPLNPAIPQSRDYHGVNRRDYILPNYALDGGFWQFTRGHYDAHYVVAEIKNLRDAPSKAEVLQVANYLNPRGTGLFALILARREMDSAAKWIRREQWVHYSKLIVGIHDEDVRQMLETKLSGGDPAELVRQRIEEFRLGI